MKFFASCIAVFIFHSMYGQYSTTGLSTINTYEDAQEFIRQNPKLEGEIMVINSLDLDEGIEKKIVDLAKGETITIEQYTYKIISTEQQFRLRSSYIFMDANKLSAFSMDSIKNVIETRFKNGTDFNTLAAEYSMDGMKDCDLGWAEEGVLLKEIEDGIRSHKVNDLFIVDLPDKKWYFIVLKTFDEIFVTESTVLKVRLNP
jgi:hypothetical protein